MTESRERSKSLLEQFDFKIYDSHYFEELESSFWDSENIMTKKYKAKREKILKGENTDNDIESLEKAYKILLTNKTRQQYCKFLMYQYTLSQPLNMDLLIENYYSIIFPFYLFPLKSEKEENKFVVLDNLNFSVNYYERNSLKNSFEVDTIEDMKLNIKENSLKIKIIKEKYDINISLLIEEHLQLLYALIIFMGIIKKKKDNWKKDQTKVNEINQNLVKETIKTIFDANENLKQKINEFKLLTLSNDSFIPKGIKYFAYIQDKSKSSSITNKFIVIGPSYIYLFKDKEMKDILNIIPLVPGVTMFEFNEREKNMKIFIGSKEYNIYMETLESFTRIQKIVMDISEGEEEIFSDEDLIKVSESLYNDKIMGGELKDTPLFCKAGKDLSLLELKIESLKRAKVKANEKGLIYKAIKKLHNINDDDNDAKDENNQINNSNNENNKINSANNENNQINNASNENNQINDAKNEDQQINEIKNNFEGNENLENNKEISNNENKERIDINEDNNMNNEINNKIVESKDENSDNNENRLNEDNINNKDN